MAQAEEGENGVTKHISMQMSNFPGDLLQRFISRNHFSHKYQQQQQRQEDNEEIELSLGLSLNGRFGVDPTRANYNNNKLIRSSSIPDFLNPISRDNDSVASMIPIGACSTNNLMRTCSLPTETEEEWRKRKELQTLRRMEAKRKRSEKKAARDKNRGFGEENCEEDVKRDEVSSVVVVVNGNYQQEQCVKVGNESLPFGGLNWVNGGGARGGGCGIELRGENSNGFGGGGDGVLPPAGVIAGVASQGSIGSQGSGSSGISEFESQLVQGIMNYY